MAVATSGRLSAIMTIMVSILLAFSISGLFYYYKIRQNEDYQNQLHFRELKLIADSLDKGVDQAINAARQQYTRDREMIENREFYESSLKAFLERVDNFAAQRQEAWVQLEPLREEMAELSGRISDYNEKIERLASDTDQITANQKQFREAQLNAEEARREEQALREELLDTEEEYAMRWQSGIVSIMENASGGDAFLDRVFAECGQGEQEGSNFCDWFESMEEDLFSPDKYSTLNGDRNAIAKEFYSALEQRLSAGQSIMGRVQAELRETEDEYRRISVLKSYVNRLSKGYPAERLRPLECGQYSEIAAQVCQKINTLLSTGSGAARSSKKSGISGLLAKQQAMIQAQSPQQQRLLLETERDAERLYEAARSEREFLVQQQKLVQEISTELKVTGEQEDLLGLISDILTLRITLANAERTTASAQQAARRTADELDQLLRQSNHSTSDGGLTDVRNLRAEALEYFDDLEDRYANIASAEQRQIEQFASTTCDNTQATQDTGSSWYRTDQSGYLAQSCSEYTQCLLNRLDRWRAPEPRACSTEEVRSTAQEMLAQLSSEASQSLFKGGTALRNASFRTITGKRAAEIFNPGEVRLTLRESVSSLSSSRWEASARYDADRELLVPLQDFIVTQLERHPVVLLVDADGARLVRKENVKIDAFQYGLTFEQVDLLLYKLFRDSSGADEGLPDSGVLGVSGSTDEIIAGEEYRVFITPYENKKLNYDPDGDGVIAEDQRFYLVGLRAKSQLLSDKLAISNSIVLVAALSIIALVMSVPLLKIRLVSQGQAFSRSDHRWVTLSTLLLCGILAVGAYDLWFYQQIKTQYEQQSGRIFEQVKKRFDEERQSLRRIAEKQYERIEALPRMSTVSKYRDRYFDYGDTYAEQAGGSKIDESYFLENLFMLKGWGSGRGKLENDAAWSSSKFMRRGNAASLNQREYFRRANTCQVWSAGSDNCAQGFFLERLFNLRDGRRSTQISQPLGNPGPDGLYHVLSYGGRLKTFLAPVLPPNFSLLVFENATGTVLYHSDDDRSLVENFYVETDTDDTVRLLAENWKKGAQPESFVATYRSQAHKLTMGPLADEIPWTLVVLFNKEELRALNLGLSAVTLLALIVLTALAVFLARYLVPRRLWRRWLEYAYFAPRSAEEPAVSFATAKTKALLIFVVILVVAQCILFEVYLRKYDRMQDVRIGKSGYSAMEARQRYRDLVLDYKAVGIERAEMPQSVACYMGHSETMDTCPVEPQFATVDNTRFQAWHPSALPLVSLVNMLSWRTELLPEERHFGELYSVPRPSLFSWWTLWSLLIVALGLLCIRILLKEWVAKRLLGIQLPPHFRVRENTEALNDQAVWGQAKSSVIRSSNCIQIIRPRPQTIEMLTRSPGGKHISGLVTDKPQTLSELIDAGWTPDRAWQYLERNMPAEEAATASGEDDKRLRILAFSGIEQVAMDPPARRRALELLEYLVTVDNLKLVLLCEVAPLYRLTHQDQYPHRDEGELEATSAEVIRWANILRQFRKIYDWSPGAQTALQDPQDPLQVLCNEARGWPEVEAIWEQFWNYHRNTLDENEASALPPTRPFSGDWQQDREKLGESLQKHWEPEQIIDFFGAHAGAFYRYRWELCTRAERLLLYQLAIGQQPNPFNIEPLEHMARRGYIYNDCGWHLVNQSFARFVLTAESATRVEAWLSEAAESTWKYMRLPIYAVVIALLAIVVYSATEALESALTILTAILGLIPLAIRNFMLFRSAGGSAE